ncbi:hypothetical protein ACFX11_009574 [Malus domestica]
MLFLLPRSFFHRLPLPSQPPHDLQAPEHLFPQLNSISELGKEKENPHSKFAINNKTSSTRQKPEFSSRAMAPAGKVSEFCREGND